MQDFHHHEYEQEPVDGNDERVRIGVYPHGVEEKPGRIGDAECRRYRQP